MTIEGIEVIPKDKMKHNIYYFGTCRNARIAKWNALEGQFYYIREKFGNKFKEAILHCDDKDKTVFDIFYPYFTVPEHQVREILN